MAVLSKEDLIAKLTASFGENLSDDNISLLEDVSDTIDSFSDTEDWKTKFEGLREKKMISLRANPKLSIMNHRQNLRIYLL